MSFSRIKAVAKAFKTTVFGIMHRKTGRQVKNVPRKIAIYYCQRYGGLTNQRVADLFELTHQGSVSPAINDVKVMLEEGWYTKELANVDEILGIIK